MAYDYCDVPLAFDYGYGDSSIEIGISDGELLTSDAEFVNKIDAILPNESTSDIAHSTSFMAIATAQGNNAHGVTGFCSDCNIIKNGYELYDYILELAHIWSNQ
jgi:hypothetical protein